MSGSSSRSAQHAVAVSEVAAHRKAERFPERVAVRVVGERDEGGFRDSLPGKRGAYSFRERAGDSLPAERCPDGGMIDMCPPSVVPAENRSRNRAVLLGDEARAGIAGKESPDAVARIVLRGNPDAAAFLPQRNCRLIVIDYHLADSHAVAPLPEKSVRPV